jgi:protocatechuate 3,4-dioxygenase beta subunit
MRYAAALLFVTLFVTAPVAQDAEFTRALERAQASRPAALTASARIAPADEPGTPLVIRGRLFAEDGTSPVAGAIVFAYHTDRGGLYDKPGTPPHSWRLRGWAQTGADGGFEFRTIRPGAYPSNRIPQHVHFTVFTGSARYHAGELRFADDPLVSAADKAAAARDGQFGDVRPVTKDGSADAVACALKLKASERF